MTPAIKQDPTASRRSPIRRRPRDVAAQRRAAVERSLPQSRSHYLSSLRSASADARDQAVDAHPLRAALVRARDALVRGMHRCEQVSEAYVEATIDGSPEELHSLEMGVQVGSALSATINTSLNEILQMEQLLDSGDLTPQTMVEGVNLLSDMTAHIEQFLHRIDVHEENAAAARSASDRTPAAGRDSDSPWASAPTRLHSTYLQPLTVPTPPPAQAPAAPAGGLGDRTRSASPEHEAAAWETMQVTIEPDANLPSADSSFTSAAASASFSATDNASPLESGSRGSSNTNITAPDENPCDEETFTLWTDQVPPREPARYNDHHIDVLRYRFPRAYPPAGPAPTAPAMRTYASGRTILGEDGVPVPTGRSHLGVIPRSLSPQQLSPQRVIFATSDSRPRPSSDWLIPGYGPNRPAAAVRRSPDHPERVRRGGPPSGEQAAPARRYSRVGRSRRRDTHSPTEQPGPPSRDPLAHPDLVIMRNTLMHMADGGEIPPQQFWASAGLTPIIAQGGELSGIRLLGDATDSYSD